MTPLLPVFFKMEGRPCLLVGGGKIALEKLRVLIECGAAVRVVARQALPAIEELAVHSRIVLHKRAYRKSDLDGAPFVIAATSDSELNHRIYREAIAAGKLVNVVDDPAYCDFYFGSIVRRGALQIAISTAGESPAFAQQLKQEIDAALPADTGSWLARLGELRRHVNRVMEPSPARTSLLRELARREVCDPETCPCRQLQ
ncbi:MAG TPA: bifunctional precorrin-2 dehydrogenase/sirohydrochlorin ferrochelatase [Bryobacteraceae bacterium]